MNNELRNKIDSLLENEKMDILKERVHLLMHRYKNESGQGNDLIEDELNAKVYASFRMPSTYKAAYDCLSYAIEYYKEDIETVIDVGAGTGASSWACYDLLTLNKITCLEQSASMMLIGQKLMEDEKINNITSWKRFDLLKDDIKENGDLVIASYVFNELEKEKRKEAIKKLYDKTDKCLLIIEPGTPAGFKIINEIKEIILQEGGYIIAPCPRDNCPMKEDDWCHFSIRVNRSKLHKLLKDGDVPYEDEKYSYVAFSKTPCLRCQNRILRHPIINKGLVKVTVCNDKGIEIKEIRKRDGDLYKEIRKGKAGDTFK